jgi:hypothetical protein
LNEGVDDVARLCANIAAHNLANVVSLKWILYLIFVGMFYIYWYLACLDLLVCLYAWFHYSPKRSFSPFKYRLNGKQKSAVLFRP